jgi:2-keto-4-pentenoate hydratase
MSQPDLITLLQAAHATNRVIATPPPALRPVDLDAAYALADRLAGGRATLGWKIGAANARGQRALALAEPFAGRVLDGTLHPSLAQLAFADRTLTIGAEFAYRLARDLRADERFDAERIASVVDALVPCLELNWASYGDPFGLGGLWIVADNGFNVGMVMGEPLPAWRDVDVARTTVHFQRDDDPPLVGSPAAANFDPLAALAWLANDRARRGDPLRAGQLVATGDFIGAIEAGPGSRVRADFGSIGRVELRLERS